MGVDIRRARIGEADALTTIAHASKSHWPYSARLVEAWRDALTITDAVIEAGIVIDADPNAESFYGACGAIHSGEITAHIGG